MVDEVGTVTPAMWDYLAERRRRPIVFHLHAADVARRLQAFEQEVQRRRLITDHAIAEHWRAIYAAWPSTSTEVH